MVKAISCEELVSLLQLAIEDDTVIPLIVSGDSMRPLFKHHKTVVHLAKPNQIKINDIILFENAEKRYILHRVIKIDETSNQVITRGDHNVLSDEATSKSSIKAIVTGFFVGKKYHQMNSSYAWFCMQYSNIRRILVRIKSKIRRIFR